MKHPLPLLTFLTALPLLLAPEVLAQTAQLQPAAQRISDSAIQADMQTYEQMQQRIKALNDKGRPVRDYHLSKAQCWLDVSFHEYTRNDRGPFPQAALGQSEALVQGMEQARALGTDTPLVGEAVRLRDDLWARADALKRHSGFVCAQQKVACAEVELVHAGNEHAQQQWRHAKPYVQIAEDLLGEADALAQSCAPAVVPPAPPPPAPVVVPPAAPPVAQLITQVVFAFDKSGERDIHPASRASLTLLIDRLRNEGWTVRSFKLTGHADRLNSTGMNDYNQRLSERRVTTVQALLVAAGFDAKLMSTAARGDGVQVEPCSFAGARVRGADLQDCLLPNRRVEVMVEAVRQ
jgi:OmpA-OmpF porin, OOP family